MTARAVLIGDLIRSEGFLQRRMMIKLLGCGEGSGQVLYKKITSSGKVMCLDHSIPVTCIRTKSDCLHHV